MRLRRLRRGSSGYLVMGKPDYNSGTKSSDTRADATQDR